MAKKKPSVWGYTVLTFLIILTFLLFSLVVTKIEAEVTFKCNSGFIGLDMEYYNYIQNKTCETDGNYTCFKEDMFMKHIKLEDVDGLNCYGKSKVEFPMILGLGMI